MICNCKAESKQHTSTDIHEFGPVDRTEKLLLAGIHPINCQDGMLQPGAFDERKLKKNDPKENISVCRKDFSSSDEVKTEIIDKILVRDPRRTYEAVFLATAETIRSIEVSGMGVNAFCVIDVGLENFPSHAAISFSDAIRGDQNFWKNANKAAGRSLRTAVIGNLTDAFQRGCCSLENAFS